MPIVYGEGRKDFIRLQEEIIRDTDDFSLLAWDDPDAQQYNGLFAHSPACFRLCQTSPKEAFHIDGEVQIHSAGITIQTLFWKRGTDLVLPLQSQHSSNCCSALVKWNSYFVRKAGRVQWDLALPKSPDNRRICIKRNVSARGSRKISSYEGLVPEDPPHSLTPLDETVTVGGSKSPIRDYNHSDEIGSSEVSVEDIASPYPPSLLSEITSHEDPIAWSAHEICSVDGALRTLECDVRPSWADETTPAAHHGPRDCLLDEAEDNEYHSPCSGPTGRSLVDGSQNFMHMKDSPYVEAQVLDVAPIAQELANIAAEQFLSDRQQRSNKRSFAPWQSQTRKRPKLIQSSNQLEVAHTRDSDDGESLLVKKSTFFACPFYIPNNKYTKCVTRHHLYRIEDVKEHVCWEHCRPMFCPVCKEEFTSVRDRDAHIRLWACHVDTSGTLEGITDE